MFTRYALYFTPTPTSPLAQFGAAWLGWDSARAQLIPHLEVAGIDLPQVSATPRKYGFHATIKPPFRLAEGVTLDALQSTLQTFAATVAPVTLEGLEPRALGQFLALCPTREVAPLQAFAGHVVAHFDHFRAPLNEAELAKRRAARLTDAQEQLLQRWGYPYVMDEFRYHMTLTGRLDPETLSAAQHAAATALADVALSPFVIDGLTLLGERADKHFEQIERYTLQGA